MAGTKKKKPDTNAKKKKEQKQKSFSPDISRQRNSIIMMAVAVFMLFVALITGERVWNALHNAWIGIFGFCTYFVSGFLVYLAYLYSKDKPVSESLGKIIAVGSFITLLCGVIHIFGEDKEYFVKTVLLDQIADVWAERP